MGMPAGALDPNVEQEQQERRADGDQEAAEVELVGVRDIEDVGGDEATDEGAGDAQQHRPEQPDRLAAAEEQSRDGADYDPPDEPGEDSHGMILERVRAADRGGGDPERPLHAHSHSIVLGGLEEMSSATRFT